MEWGVWWSNFEPIWSRWQTAASKSSIRCFESLTERSSDPHWTTLKSVDLTYENHFTHNDEVWEGHAKRLVILSIDFSCVLLNKNTKLRCDWGIQIGDIHRWRVTIRSIGLISTTRLESPTIHRGGNGGFSFPLPGARDPAAEKPFIDNLVPYLLNSLSHVCECLKNFSSEFFWDSSAIISRVRCSTSSEGVPCLWNVIISQTTHSEGR
jgi:hypothetical protein